MAQHVDDEIEAVSDDLQPLIAALGKVVRRGLPIRPSQAPGVLMTLDGVIARSVRPDDELARVDALDRLMRQELRRLGLVELRRPAAMLFGIGASGFLTDRRRAAAVAADRNLDHFRKWIEPKIIEQLAWQLYRDSLQYVERTRGAGPFEASGSTPVITEESIGPEAAERAALLSEVWSEVYGLRSELIRREASRDVPDMTAEFEDAAGGSLWRLARLLTKLDTYLEKFGAEILHGSATYNAESLIRVAGWTGDVTAEEARDLRYVLARTNEWNRATFTSGDAPGLC